MGRGTREGGWLLVTFDVQESCVAAFLEVCCAPLVPRSLVLSRAVQREGGSASGG